MGDHNSTGQQAERWLREMLSTDFVTRELKQLYLYQLRLQHQRYFGPVQVGFQRGLPNTVKVAGCETLTIDQIRDRLRSV